MAKIPTAQDAAHIILTVFSELGYRPGQQIEYEFVAGKAMRYNRFIRMGEIQKGYELLLDKGFISGVISFREGGMSKTVFSGNLTLTQIGFDAMPE